MRLGLASLFFVGALSWRLWGLDAMGNVWDEYFYYDAARDFARNVVRLDFDANHWQSNLEHPPLGKYVYAPTAIWNKWRQVADRDAYHAPRVISALLGSITVAVVFLIGAKFFSHRTGWLAGLVYALLPPVVAYHKIINLDVTMALFFTLSMYYFLDWVKKEYKSTKPLWLSVISSSLAIATKFNAALMAIIFFGVLVIDQWRLIRKSASINLPIPLILMPLISLASLIIIWPWLWSNTLDHFLQTLQHWGGTISEQFWGGYGPAPVWYFVTHFIFGTPAVVLGLLAVGLGRVIKTRKPVGWTLLLWLAAPFFISFYHLRQDHLRYVLAAFPAVALIASLGFWWLVDRFTKGRFWLSLIGVLVISYYLLVISYNIHPYYLNYYNELVGGSRGVAAKNLFALGFYGEGIKEATEFVNHTALDGAIVNYEIIPDDAPYLDRPRLTRYDAIAHATQGYDYLIVNANALRDDKKRQIIEAALPNLKKVYTVKAGGAEFVWVYKRKK